MGNKLLLLIFCFFIHHAYADKLNSDSWNDMRDIYLSGDSFVLDNNIKVIMQDLVEEPHEVSMVVKLPEYLYHMQELVVLIENNPIQEALRLYPYRYIERVGMNVRLENNSPVRVAVLKDNTWHIGSKMVYVSSPGGCSLPSCDPSKENCSNSEIGKSFLKSYKRTNNAQRIKYKISHPMDTGFVIDNLGQSIPEYYIKNISFADEKGMIANVETSAALSTDPVFLLDLQTSTSNITVNAVDSKGIEYGQQPTVSW